MKGISLLNDFKNPSSLLPWGFIIVVISLFFSPPAVVAGEKQPDRVLVLNSYHQGYAWSDGVMEGIQSVLGGEPNIELNFEYMDAKHYSSQDYLEKIYEIYKLKFRERHFDLVIASDEIAFQFVLDYQREIFKDTPVVFCGVHGFKDAMIRGRKNLFTGVVEEHDVKETLEVALNLHPGARKVFVVHDKSNIALSMRKQFDEVIRKNDYPVDFYFWVEVDMEKLQRKVQYLSGDSFIYYLIFLKDKSGNYFSPEESVFKISSHSSVPTYGLGDFLLGHGIVGGMLNSGFHQGKTAAQLALRILRGESVQNIPVVKESPNRHMFDYQQMRRFGIKPSALPHGSIVINKPPSFYQEYKRLVWATFTVIVSLTIIIVILLINIVRRRKSEEQLRHEHELLSNIISHIPHAVFWKDTKSMYLGCNDNFARAAGLDNPEQIVGKTDYDLAWEPRDAEFFQKNDQEVIYAGEPILNMEVSPQLADRQDAILLTSKVPIRDAGGNVIGILGIFSDITQRKKSEEANARLAIVVRQAAEMIIITDTEGAIEYVNPAFEKITGFTMDEALGKNLCDIMGSEEEQELHQQIWDTLWLGKVWKSHCTNKKKDGSLYEGEVTISPVRDASGVMISYVAIARDVTQEVMMEMQLRQAQKLEAIGRLAAGIAHEINTPSQYVGDNTRFLKEAFADLLGLLKKHEHIISELENQSLLPDLASEAKKEAEEADLEYLVEEIPQAIDQSLDGIERVARIVRAMKEFSHPGAEEKTPIDINKAIDSTITVARNEWKYVADMKTDFDPNLPLVPCLPGEFNQVILNMIVNAAHAIADVLSESPDTKGAISVATRKVDDWAEIRISDTGCGIPPHVQAHIFDPFFTTKEVGKGTGQGLAISHNVVVEKHRGSISFETETGKGTTFIIRLPLNEDTMEK